MLQSHWTTRLDNNDLDYILIRHSFTILTAGYACLDGLLMDLRQ